jgi:murein DD-endopeptidase MepM/ murein hydrolase activator NlpD
MTSIIITKAQGKAWRFSMPSRMMRLIGMGMLFLVVFFVISVGMNLKLLIHYRQTKQALTDQKMQTKVIQTLQTEVDSLRKIMQDLIQKEEAIRQDLGRPKFRKMSDRRRIQLQKNRFNNEYPLQDYNVFVTHQLTNEIEYIKANTVAIEKKMRHHFSVAKQYREWFDQTPSIWPVYGYVRSKFGWRTHPLKQTLQFHKGIDIPAWVGAPVQATADGYVDFSGWGGGYGWIVVLSHQFGYKTIYAHLSEIEVVRGAKVSKGEIIGKVGTSGLSTGPHVHYEIRFRQKALEPSKYLNLDLFTAISSLW